MPTGKERAAYDITLPLHNAHDLKCIAVIAVTATAGSTDLSTLFGNLDSGDFLTLVADPGAAGGKLYFAFQGSDATAISDTATGTNAAACWPLFEGIPLSGTLPTGREVGSAYGATYVKYQTLHYKAPSGTSGYLRVFRSSHQHHNVGANFKAP